MFKEKYYFRIYKCKCGGQISMQEAPFFYNTAKLTEDVIYETEQCVQCWDSPPK